MNFRLVYNGPLRAASQSETRRLEKHAIRRVFNQQLNTLFAGHYALQEEFGNEGVDEQAFRFNTRKDGTGKITDRGRFDIAMSQITGKRLTYAELTGKVGETQVPF